MESATHPLYVGVVGGGVVGRATARTWVEHVKEVRVFDIDHRRRTHSLAETVEDSHLIFVCVPETEVNTVFDRIDYEGDKIFLVRSTCPVGTTQALADRGVNVFHYPEFLTARCAHTDAQCPPQVVLGYPSQHSDQPEMAEHLQFLRRVFSARFPGVAHNVMRSDESELMKLVLNTFFAVKVSFFNEVYSLVDKLGLSWDRVMKGVLADGRVCPSHTMVPGPDGWFGFGGKCLPKDLNTLASLLHEKGCSPLIMDAAYLRNRQDRRRDA